MSFIKKGGHLDQGCKCITLTDSRSRFVPWSGTLDDWVRVWLALEFNSCVLLGSLSCPCFCPSLVWSLNWDFWLRQRLRLWECILYSIVNYDNILYGQMMAQQSIALGCFWYCFRWNCSSLPKAVKLLGRRKLTLNLKAAQQAAHCWRVWLKNIHSKSSCPNCTFLVTSIHFFKNSL